MRIFRSRVLLVLVSVAACAAEGPRERGAEDAVQPGERSAEGRTPKVLIIGIDGVRPDILAEVPTPNLDALAELGAYSGDARTGMPSVSGPGWSSLLIGVWPEKHGVTDNTFEGKQYERYPDFLTRIEQVRPELSTFAVADWLPLVGHGDGGPVISDAVDAKHVLDGYELGWPEADSQSVALAVEALTGGDPDALFVYLGNPDETSHEQGSIGEEYRGALALADRHVGELVAAIRSRPTYPTEDWLILSSTDHGRRADGGHGGDTPEERTIYYLVSGPRAVRGSLEGPIGVVDVAVTALAHLGIPTDPAWELDGAVVGLTEERNR
jgi:predicted AlkP superfamily pyrophosphatase or phosphodiesterase